MSNEFGGPATGRGRELLMVLALALLGLVLAGAAAFIPWYAAAAGPGAAPVARVEFPGWSGAQK